ncbi:ATP-binding cassette domain-containing protein [Aestuariirhabdus sp. Z084]|uniref:ATP-binding cassette domain-containing protein n=1 Tax=Aestuariirhabdus haliotis TaxID=2918751 RepID=UPI00201B3912|nr:ATP-binding cassette domain-containing protein [Aestuariirhabdus haliotis]MCL6414373.1 ATP-binding cassette domain-containing protein [Aestuariirhabdus haliotis]MCL6418305.1 ATP-binding cassette domain-containing protein [Aestuariirhabdus haliotis]
MIRLQNAELLRGGKPLLEEASLTIHHGQHVGLVGANGCGKSSLFALLQGELHLDSGDLSVPSPDDIAHMAQEIVALERSAIDYVIDGDKPLRAIEQQLAEAEQQHRDDRIAPLHEQLSAIDGYNAKTRASKLLSGLGFTNDDLARNVREFSGGWRMRLNLARTLMCRSQLLLLDEPTNHLDLDAILWLEQWLKQYPGTLLVISHDRDFLDAVTDQIAHIERQRINFYRGNYSAFEKLRAEQLSQQQASFEKQQQQRAHIESYIRRFRAKATKARQAQSRIKALARMEEIAPAHVDSPFSFIFPPADKISSTLITLDRAALGYGDGAIVKNVNLSIHPGSAIGLLGPNGAGKSTLIKSLAGQLAVMAGERSCGEHLRIGYFAQHQIDSLDDNASPLLHLQRISPDAREQQLRDFLGGFNFRGDQASDVIRHFSGGEKARLALAIIAWQKPNLLLLDEPTNHLDLEMRHALTLALQEHQGAMVLVSHDRHLIRNTTDELWLVSDGCAQPYDEDLDQYSDWLARQRRLEDKAEATADSTNAAPVDRKELKRRQAEQRKLLSPLRNQLQKLEKQLDSLHQQSEQIEQQLSDSTLYEEGQRENLKETLALQASNREQCERCEEQWMELQEQIETLQAGFASE